MTRHLNKRIGQLEDSRTPEKRPRLHVIDRIEGETRHEAVAKYVAEHGPMDSNYKNMLCIYTWPQEKAETK